MQTRIKLQHMQTLSSFRTSAHRSAFIRKSSRRMLYKEKNPLSCDNIRKTYNSESVLTTLSVTGIIQRRGKT